MFRFLVLGLLRDGELRHGYALMKNYLERSGLEVSTGNFYRELQRLASAGMVKTAVNPPGADARRTPYQITDLGASTFDAWISGVSTVIMPSYEDELSARAFFVSGFAPALARRLFDQWKDQLWVCGKTLERSRQIALARAARGDGIEFSALALFLARRMKHVAADLEFVDEMRSSYEEWSAAKKIPASRNRIESSRTKPDSNVAESPAARTSPRKRSR